MKNKDLETLEILQYQFSFLKYIITIKRKRGTTMKLICKCGNIEEIFTDKLIKNYIFKDCGDGTVALVCKICNDVVFIKVKNS